MKYIPKSSQITAYKIESARPTITANNGQVGTLIRFTEPFPSADNNGTEYLIPLRLEHVNPGDYYVVDSDNLATTIVRKSVFEALYQPSDAPTIIEEALWPDYIPRRPDNEADAVTQAQRVIRDLGNSLEAESKARQAWQNVAEQLCDKWEANEPLYLAIHEADSLLQKLGGIAGVSLYLASDGNNTCDLINDKLVRIASGESKSTLLEAINIAKAEWRFARLISPMEYWSRETVIDALREAVEIFEVKSAPSEDAKPAATPHSGIFTTDAFQQAINEDAYAALNDDYVIAILEAHPRVVRLTGGNHWYLLPPGIERSGQEGSANGLP